MSTVRVVAVPAGHPRGSATVWVIGATILTLTLTVQPLSDSTAWWHLALGRLITAHGLPSQEPFSFLSAAHAWTGQGWLFAVLLAGLVGAGGAGLASMVTGVAASAGLGLGAAATSRASRVAGPWFAVAMIVSAVVASPWIGVDGAAISMLGVGVVLVAVARWRDGQTGLLWALPPLFLVWANLDGGFILGLVVALLAVLTTVIADRGETSARAPLLALAAAAIASCVNPEGLGVYASALSTAIDPAIAQLSTAWASPDFHTTLLRLFEVEAAMLVVCWIAAGPPDPADAVVGTALIALALWSAQFIPFFAVVATPQLARYSSRAWTLHLASRVPVLRGGERIARWRPVATVALALAGLVAVAVVVPKHVTAQASAAYESSHYPKSAADYVAATYGTPRLYSTAPWADYLAYRFPSSRSVFLYDNGGAFGDGAVAAYSRVHLLEDGWENELDAQAIHHAIVGDASVEASALHELGWVVDCHDAAAAAVVMSSPAPGAPSSAAAPLAVPPASARAC